MSRSKPILIKDKYFKSVAAAAKELRESRTEIKKKCDSIENKNYAYTEYVIPQFKTCCVCKEEKSLEEFNNASGRIDKKHTMCRRCASKQNKEKVKTLEFIEHRKNYMLQWYHGITLEDYNKKFEEQKGKCAICGMHQTELKRPLVVDHDHKTGKMRGLLCNLCNWGLGSFQDNIVFIENGINYLLKYKN